jgi:hypothetical protein
MSVAVGNRSQTGWMTSRRVKVDFCSVRPVGVARCSNMPSRTSCCNGKARARPRRRSTAAASKAERRRAFPPGSIARPVDA